MKRTSVYLKVWAAALALVVFVGSCKDDEEQLPPIDGYNSSDEVAAANLVAHWSFDADQKERISGAAPSATFGTVTTTPGKIGNALQLNKGVLVYPTIAGINTANALNNFTVSLWVKTTNNKGQTVSGYQQFFSLFPEGVTDIWPDLGTGAETGHYLPSSDTLKTKGNFITHPAGAPASNQDNLALVNDGKGKWFLGAKDWAHMVVRWDATTHKLTIFMNKEDSGAWTERGETGVLIMDVPVRAVFGSLASSDIGFEDAPAQPGWNPWATASIDDVRIFNTALSQAEVTALFNLGNAGR